MTWQSITGGGPASPINGFGSGDRGSRTISSNVSEGGKQFYTTFTLEAGNTLTIGSNPLIILATESITINGTIDGDGAGPGGGHGGYEGYRSDSSVPPGTEIDLGVGYTGGAGGSGGESSSFRGRRDGARGGEPQFTQADFDRMKPQFQISNNSPDPLKKLIDGTLSLGGHGGGGGGTGSEHKYTPSDGYGPGGDGGSGGGGVLLMAPEVTINGTVTLRGGDGQDGHDGTSYNSADRPGGGGGGGGGGSGGLLLVYATTYTNSGTVDLSGGAGGAKGVAENYRATDGTAGDPGDRGKEIHFNPNPE